MLDHNSRTKLTAKEHDPVEYYTRAVNKYPLLKKEEETELAYAIASGDKMAEEKFIRANLRLVLKVASNYRKRGLAFSDIIEEGNIGLMHAVKRYDPSKGFRFATYAVWWIRQAIERALMTQTRTIRLPVHVVKQLSKCVRDGEKAAHAALKSNISDTRVASESSLSLENIRSLLSLRHNTISLESRTSSDSERDFNDFIVDDNNPEMNVAELDLERHLDKVMQALKPEEIIIIKLEIKISLKSYL